MLDNETSWFARVPKVELHLHLEGAIPLDALWELLGKYGGDAEVPDRAALERRFAYRDFRHFIDTWVWKNRFLREHDDFTFIAEAVARDLAHQRVRYVEAFYSPPDFERVGLEPQRLTSAIRSGLSRVPEVTVALVADLVRDSGPTRAARTLAALREVRELGVIGIGIGGSEAEHPPEPFAPVYEEARRLGFRTSAHAGEAAGAASVWGALRALAVDRIGHGTRAIEDEALVETIARRRIPVEMCPISNLRTRVVAAPADLPIRHYLDRGVVVTINSDDPKMFNTSLAAEYALLERDLGFSRQEIRALILNGIRASWMSDEEKRRLGAEFEADPAWSGAGAREACEAVTPARPV